MIVEPAPAKLNLVLHVRARRPDGYHDLETLFAFVADGDVVTVAPADRDRFDLTGPFAAALAGSEGQRPEQHTGSVPESADRHGPAQAPMTNVLPGGEPRDVSGMIVASGRSSPTHGDNLVLRARDAFRNRFGAPPVAITLDKRLPVASGIGGGSADAAATLRALARMQGVAADDPALFDCAAALGSDIPACLLGRATIGTGRGDRLRPAGTPPPLSVLLVNPGVAVATPAVFAAWDGIDRGAMPSGDAMAIAAAGRNDLEAPAIAVAPVVVDVLDRLRALSGVRLARMSGSGATCFALFDTSAACRDAARAVAAAEPGWWCLETALA